MTAVGERWAPFFDGNYEVSSHGRVRRAKPGRRTTPGRILALQRLKIGYMTVNPVRDGKNVSTYVHHLVAEAFLGPRPPGLSINHLDGDKTNNHVENLEYVTHAANMAHAARTGLMQHGEGHASAKLSDAQVDAIRAARVAGERGVDVARRFGVSQTTVCNIYHGQRRASRDPGRLRAGGKT